MGIRAAACSLLFASRATTTCAFRFQAARPSLAGLKASHKGCKVSIGNASVDTSHRLEVHDVLAGQKNLY